MTKTLTVIVPAFNEEASIGRVVSDLLTTLDETLSEVIVVNDASSDHTKEEALRAGARVIDHRRNRGYGASLKTGIRASNTEAIGILDADGQHRAVDLRAMWGAFQQGTDMVIGSRQGILKSKFWRMPGKWVIAVFANYLLGQKIPDLNSGLRIFRRDVVMRYLHLCPDGFSMSTTLTMTLVSRGYAVDYYPIAVVKRTDGKSRVRVRDGFNSLLLILRMTCLFNPFRVFLPASIALILFGLVWGLPILLAREGLSVGALLFILSGLFSLGMGILCDQISQLRLERFENN
jgi:glycosyltransferase involved in cell wall biosynthesis